MNQDYSLSKEMITSLGLSIVELEHFGLSRIELNHTQLSRNELYRNELKHLEFFTLRRGVIGVRRIGYV